MAEPLAFDFSQTAALDDDEIAQSVSEPMIALNSDETALEIVAVPSNGNAKEPEQVALFEKGEWWEEHWKGMPEFIQEDKMPFKTLLVHFEDQEDIDAFSALVQQKIGPDTKSIWHPEAEIAHGKHKKYVSTAHHLPKYPVYIVSKGRWETRHTSRTLHQLGVKHFIVVEQQEFNSYKAAIDDSATLLILDPLYQEAYDACDDLGMTKSKGPGPARNFVWDHAQNVLKSEWHWVMDDNIDGFARLTDNLKTFVADGTMFRCMEDFCERYENVAMGGPNYWMFAKRKQKIPPFIFNTRIYSCNLIRNDVPYRWRGRYNEDTDLSIRMMRDGFVTVQFNAFLQNKLTTQSVAGGCNAEFYEKEGTGPKSEMQVRLHPDISRLTERFGRIHHYVDYSVFEHNIPKLKADVQLKSGVDNYGMFIKVNGAQL